jgi:hypothetical protein
MMVLIFGFSGLDLFWGCFFFQGEMPGFQQELPLAPKLSVVPLFPAAGMKVRFSVFSGFQGPLLQPDLKVS